MGTRTLFLIAASLISGTALMISMSQQAATNDATVSEYQEEILLNQIIKSAESLVMARAKRDFDNAPTSISYTDIAMKGGHFSASAVANGDNEITVTVTAEYEGMQREVKTTLERTLSGGTLDAALLIDTPSAEIEMTGQQFCVIGNDYSPPSIGGSSPGHHIGGVRTSSQLVRDQVRTAMSSTKMGNIIGVNGQGDIYHDTFNIDFNNIYNDAIQLAGQTHDGQNLSGTYGTTESPVILHVTGDADIQGNVRGYGMLVIDGDLDTSNGTLKWEGTVVINKESDLLVKIAHGSRVYGGVIIMNGAKAFNMPGNGTLDVMYYKSGSSMASSLDIKPVGETATTLFAAGANSAADQTFTGSTSYELGQQINFLTTTTPPSSSTYSRMARYNDPAFVAQPHAKIRALTTDSWEITFETGSTDDLETMPEGVETANWDYYDEKIVVNYVSDNTVPAGDNTPGWETTFGFNTEMTSSPASLDLQFHGTGTIIYSSEAVARVAAMLPALNQNTSIVIKDRSVL
ncbi:MAG: hypothetical protein AB8G77_20865 [Rhodothermales bacterium]